MRNNSIANGALNRFAVGFSLMFLISELYKRYILELLNINQNIVNIISLLVLWGIGGLAVHFCVKDMPIKPLPNKNLSKSAYITAFFLNFTGMAIMIIFTSVLSTIGFIKVDEQTNILANKDNMAYMVFSLLVFNPIVEELFFRIFPGMRLSNLGEGVFLLAFSYMFALPHILSLKLGFLSCINTFLCAYVWGYVYIKSGNPLLPILFHSLANFFGSVLSNMLPSNMLSIYVLIMFVFAIMGIVLLIINRKKISVDGNARIFSSQDLSTVFSNTGIILYTFVIIVLFYTK